MKKLITSLAIGLMVVLMASVSFAADAKIKVGGVFILQCVAPDGTIKWEVEAKNLVTNQGLNHINDVVLHGTAATATWYVGLKNAGAIAAADTMASHSGWTENVAYSQATRVEYNEAASSSQVTTNSANVASFSINANSQTIAGAFLTSVSTKSGTTGILLAVADAASSQSANTGDTIRVTYTFTATDV